MTARKKSDEEILFPEAKIADITVKPWSFGMLFKLGPLVEKVLKKMEEQDINIDTDIIKYSTIAKLFTIASEPVLEIICLTTGKDRKTIEGLGIGDGVKIAFLIYSQNKEQIVKNLTSLAE